MSNSDSFDTAEVVRRALKYLIMGIVVAIGSCYIPQGKKLDLTEIIMIGITASATFAILDMYVPSVRL